MKILKPAMIAGIAGALALGSVTASQARVRPWVAGAAGFAAGAAIGSAAANSYYYNNGYGYYDDSYAYAYDRPATAYTGDPAYAGYNAYGYSPGYYGYSSGPYWQERRLEGRDY